MRPFTRGFARNFSAMPVGGALSNSRRTGVFMLRRVFVGCVFAAAAVAIVGVGVSALAQNQPPSSPAVDGEAVYRTTCATCHEAGVARAGTRETLARMSADNIRFA